MLRSILRTRSVPEKRDQPDQVGYSVHKDASCHTIGSRDWAIVHERETKRGGAITTRFDV